MNWEEGVDIEMEHSTKPDVAALENDSIDLKKSWSREVTRDKWFVSCILYSSSVNILSSPLTELDLPFNNQPGVRNDKTCGQASWQL